MSTKDFVEPSSVGYNPFQEMHNNSRPHVHASSIAFNVKLTFIDVNAFGAKIYCDPRNKYLVKVEDRHPTQAHQILWAKYQGDHYVDQDGGSYVITLDPGHMDKLGNPISVGHATTEVPAWTRERPGTSLSHLHFESPGKERHEHNIEFQGTILVHRLKTFDSQKVLYRDDEHNYYTTLESARIEHPPENTLYVCRGMLDLSCQYYDSKGREYALLNSTDLRDFSLVPDDKMFYEKASAPKSELHFTELKPLRFDPPMFGHTHVPDTRGMNTLESNGIKVTREPTKPHEGRLNLPGTSDVDDERKHEDEYAQRVRPS